MSGLFNPTVAWITTRATLGRKRALLFAIPAVVLIVVTVALKAGRPPDRPWPSHVLGTFGFSVLPPPEIRAAMSSGTAAKMMVSTVATTNLVMITDERRTGVASRWMTLPSSISAPSTQQPKISAVRGSSTEAVVTLHPNGPPTVVPGMAVNSTDFAIGLFVGALVGAVIYNAIFVMVSAATTRAIAVGLLYVLIWEAVLSNFVSGARLLSVSHYSLGIANGIAHDSTLGAGLTATVSIVMGAIVTVLALVLAVNLLSSFTLKGEPA